MSQAGTITQLLPGDPGRMNRPQRSHFGMSVIDCLRYDQIQDAQVIVPRAE